MNRVVVLAHPQGLEQMVFVVLVLLVQPGRPLLQFSSLLALTNNQMHMGQFTVVRRKFCKPVFF